MKLLPAVRRQYEAMPYPHRRPRDERTRLIAIPFGQLALVNHIFWSGRRRFDEHFRVLDAGCGTGDSTVFMAEQLRKTKARVTALDISKPSLDITRQRIAARGLSNVDLVHGAIEEIPTMGLGQFDYVVASGVLHHLASPEEGLRILRDVLKPDGGMGMLLYGQYGRTAIYQMQELFRLLAPADWRESRRITAVKKVLPQLHSAHWAAFAAPSWKGEVQANGDAGYLDLFLHSQDRAYTVPQLYELMDACRMQLLRFEFQKQYDPHTWAQGLDLDHLTKREQQAAAELLFGRMARHQFFAVRADSTPPVPPSPDDERAISVWTHFELHNATEVALKTTGKADVPFYAEGKTVTLPEVGRALINAIDSRHTVGEVLTAGARAFPHLRAVQIQQEWRSAFTALNDLTILALNRPLDGGAMLRGVESVSAEICTERKGDRHGRPGSEEPQ